MLRQLLLSLLAILGLSEMTSAQDSSRPACIDVSRITLSTTLLNRYESSFIPGSYRTNPPGSLPEHYASLRFIRGSLYSKQVNEQVPRDQVSNTQVLRFSVCNTADTAISVWFFPGLYFYHLYMYELDGGQLRLLPSVMPSESGEICYRRINVAAHDSMTILVSMMMVRTHLNRIRPELIHQQYLEPWVVQMDNRNIESKVISYVFCGLLLMMVMFSLTSFFQNANPEFLYYSGYAFLIGVMLFIKALYSYHSSWFGYFQEGYLDYIMQSVGILFYMIFMQKFLSTRSNHPVLHQLYNFGEVMLLLSLVLFTYFHYFTSNYVWENRIENITKVGLLGMILVFCVYSFRFWEDKLLRYLFYGNLCMLVFSLLSLLLVNWKFIPQSVPQIFRNSLFYYEIGLFLELVLFLAGLNHKNKRQLVTEARERERLKADNQMKEYEKEIAVYKAQQGERERISADMHDELGSGMTAIRLMSEIARNKMKDSTPVEIDKISHSADEVLNKMNAIIWSMNSGNDTLDNLVSYIRSYALEYFEYTPITCRISVPENVPEMELTGDRRRNLFLCVKETLNNALKHSKATEITIGFEIREDLRITIRDNGVGADFQQIRQFGNGLKNITKRMTSIGGTYDLKNDHGTVTTLILPLDHAMADS
ncbi:MAG: sensor histidine kinase [Chitinophagaceae bacterium]|nr:MAG: sensor histidine kinase [Chitinophagaceae bacterium]